MNYNPNTFTYGYEIEWGDIDRRIAIPEHLGTWDYSETDILNIHQPEGYIATDPLGLKPHWGGEINTKPTETIWEQEQRIIEIMELFIEAGNTPSAACVNEGHVHVHVPGLKDDIHALTRLTDYIYRNQDLVIEKCAGFVEHPDMKTSKGAKAYLKYDIGRRMPEYMALNILTKATDFNSFIKMQCAGKDGVSMGRPFRYAINTYCLKHTNTIEFRCFRSTTDNYRILNQLLFVQAFVDAALNSGPNVEEILDTRNYIFPQFYWNKEEYDAWIATKYPKERGKKVRNYYEIL